LAEVGVLCTALRPEYPPLPIDILLAARRIYQAAGFTLIEEERHHSFGKDLVGQIWRKDLSPADG
jgi:hypothetical protein